MPRMSMKRAVCYGLLVFVGMTVLYSWLLPCNNSPRSVMVPKEPVQYVYDEQSHAYPYDRQMPLIFIGGVPRSGTTLMRAILDAHPDVRCGEETRVIPRMLGMRSQWAKSPKESKRLQEAGLSDEVIDSALAAFILEVIAKHGEPAPRLCNKDPFTLKSSIYLSQMFPASKFILMVRDGRAVVHSIISRKVTISGFDLKSFRKCLEKWNIAMETMYYQCLRLGLDRCLPVYYEQLVLHPEDWVKRILEFLDIPWDDAVLHHEQFINKPKGISLSRTERSTDQVIKPINMDALTRWVSAVPDDVRQDIDYIAPMLQKLGYDSRAYPPSYGQADDFVASNTHNVRQRREYWQKKSQEVQLMTKPPPSYGFRRPETADKTGKEHDEKDNSGIKQGVDDGRDSKETAAGESPPVLNTQTNQNKVSMGSDSADPKQNSDVQKHPVIQHDAKDTEDHSSR